MASKIRNKKRRPKSSFFFLYLTLRLEQFADLSSTVVAVRARNELVVRTDERVNCPTVTSLEAKSHLEVNWVDCAAKSKR